MPDRLFDPQSIHVIGWTLVHFLWQGALIGAGVGVASRLLRRYEASWRYGVACAGLLAMTLSAVVTAAFLSLQQHPIVPFDVSVSWIESQLPFVCVAWCLGVAGLSLRLAGGWLLVYRLKTLAEPVHHGLQVRVDEIRSRLGIGRHVQVFRSTLVRVPMVVGWLKPVILIPGSLVTGIPAAELEALLAHELGHIRRYDYLVNGLQTLIETVFFFHPAVWWVSKQIRLEREHCCDDLALLTADKVIYTRALLELEQLKGAGLTFSYSDVRADGGHLVTRIRRLVTSPESGGTPFVKLLCGLTMAALLLASVEMSNAGRATMLDPAIDVLPLDVAARFDQGTRATPSRIPEVRGPEVLLPAVLDRAPIAGANPPDDVSARSTATIETAETLRRTVEPAPPVAHRDDKRAWRSGAAFLASSRRVGGDPRATTGRFGFGLGGGVIQSSSIGPLSPNVEIRTLYALDGWTQLEVGASFSMFLNSNLYAYIQDDGHQVEETANFEQQWQVSLGIRRAFDDRRLTGLYYGISTGVMRLPINRLIGDMDKSQEAYESKVGAFLLPKVGYVTRASGKFAWDLSAGLSFSRVNGVEFVQPTVSMGINFWR